MRASFLRVLGTSVGVTALGAASHVLLARLLEPERRGLLAAAMLGTALIAAAAQLGLAPAWVVAMRHAPPPRPGRWLLGSVAAVAGAALAGVLAWWLQAGAAMAAVGLPLVAAVTAGHALHMHLCGLAQVEDRMRLQSRLRAVAAVGVLAALLGAVIAAPADFGPPQAAAAYVLAYAAALGLAVAHRRVLLPPAADRPAPAAAFHWREPLRQSLHTHLTTLLGLLSVNLDKLWLAGQGGTAQLGLYTVAFTASRLIGAVQESAAATLFARHAGRAGADAASLAQLSDDVARAFRRTFWPMLAAAGIAGGAVIALPVVETVFGPAYRDARGPLALLLAECVLGQGSWLLAQRFTGTGRTGLVALRQAVALVPVVAALPALGHLVGPVATDLALVMLGGSALRLGVTVALLHRHAGLPAARLLPGTTNPGSPR